MLRIYKPEFEGMDRQTRQFCIKAADKYPIIKDVRNALSLRFARLVKTATSSRLLDESLGEIQTHLWWLVTISSDQAFLEVIDYLRELEEAEKLLEETKERGKS